ncbi:MAG: hypothetical protein FWF24_02345 [Alphaproteobacteria bacterium]|nr:hypothetical protein [Alphaproteobacteria bacterium]
MWPYDDWRNAYHINKHVIDDMVSSMNRRAFARDGAIIPFFGIGFGFYSGPDQENVIDNMKKPFGPYNSNDFIYHHARILQMAQRTGIVLIDHTPVGQVLENFRGFGKALIQGKGTKAYFKEHPERESMSENEKNWTIPWMHASRYFAWTAHGHILTFFCGLNPERVAYRVEIPSIINPFAPVDAPLSPVDPAIQAIFLPRKHPYMIETINGFPFEWFQRFNMPNDLRPAYEAFCTSEIHKARMDYLVTINPKTIRAAVDQASAELLVPNAMEAASLFLELREAFRVGQAYIFNHTSPPLRKSDLAPPEVRSEKRNFKMTEIGFMVFSCLKAEDLLRPFDKRLNIKLPNVLSSKMTPKAGLIL